MNIRSFRTFVTIADAGGIARAGAHQRLKDLLARWMLALPSEGANLEGLRLLKENLSPLQREQLELFNYFDVVGGDTGAHYRVHFDHQMNVEQLETSGKSVAWFCFVPEGQLPVADTVLAQKMALELFETEALREATRMPPSLVRNPPYGFRY